MEIVLVSSHHCLAWVMQCYHILLEIPRAALMNLWWNWVQFLRWEFSIPCYKGELRSHMDLKYWAPKALGYQYLGIFQMLQCWNPDGEICFIFDVIVVPLNMSVKTRCLWWRCCMSSFFLLRIILGIEDWMHASGHALISWSSSVISSSGFPST